MTNVEGYIINMLVLNVFNVCCIFGQGLGAVHSKNSSKYAFLAIFDLNCKKWKIKKNDAKNMFFELTPKCRAKVCFQDKRVFIGKNMFSDLKSVKHCKFVSFVG